MPRPPDSTPHVPYDSDGGNDGVAEKLPGADDDFGFSAGLRDATALGPGSRLGSVTIVRLVAEGGMGRVYEGRQDAPDRTVAVKILREGLGTPTAVRRFQQESDVLGRLEHPGIARIYAAGVERSTAGDQPYFIMEFVADATPVTDFAVGRRLSLRERVGLFARVAAAVAAAHREGVVHRDLKPSNVLVGANGEPKLIDFGIARAIDPDSDRVTAEADLGRLLGTVRYMAPEQVGIHGNDADRRSDVYALGLVLHELLLGELPYELGGKSVVEAASILAARAGGDARALTRSLRRRHPVADDASSLAVILATCLEPRPADRYQTARDLAADLERWLAGQAIQARPPTLFESTARLARRHRVAAGAFTTAAVSLVIAVGVFAWAWQTAERQRDIATRARAAAESARQAADEQRSSAEAHATEIRRQLYLSTVQLAAEARDRDNLTEARRLLAEARNLAPGVASHPIELDYLAASLDESLAVIDAGEGTVTAVAGSGDGAAVAGGTDRGRVFMWKPGHVETTIAQLDGPVWAVAMSPDGSRIAIGRSDGQVQIHDAGGGDAIMTFSAHDGTVYSLAYSPDGHLLATASRDRSVRLWSTVSWELREQLLGHEGTVLSVCFAPDGERILTTSSDGTARIWNAADGAQMLRVGDGSSRLFRGVLGSDGKRFATAGEDGKVRVHDAGSGRLRATLVHPRRVNSIAFIDDGARLAAASGDAVLRVWDVTSGTVVARRRGHADGIWSLAALPTLGSRDAPAEDPRTTVVTGSADGTVRTWDLGASGEPIVDLGSRGISVATCGARNLLAVGTATGEAWLVDATMLRERCRLTGLVDRVNSIAVSPDGSLMAAADDAGTIHRWTVPDAKPFASPLVLHVRRAFDVVFSPDGKTMATAGEDRTARLVDPLTGEDRVPPLKHPARVFRTTFSPDGCLLATACEDRHVRLWDAATGHELACWPGHARAVNWVEFAPDGQHMASASSDGSIRVWNAVPTKAPPAPMVLTGPTGQVWKVAFSPDGSRIAATAADGLVHLWDTATGRPVTVLRGHRDATWGLAFLDDGRALATASWDGTLRLWGIPMATLATARDATED